MLSFCTTGSTNTLAPMTTFWPDRSVEISPEEEVTARPRLPVTRKAWLGPATLIRDRMSSTSSSTRTITPPMAMRMGDMDSRLL